ncbi:IS200/IS605 family transposase [Pollutibacter soli]|uniref:IS200/IS605 family transposase n=1 Tax=Pollutibacter soli TaxID=3034157 RepID=UPI003AF59D63
MGQSLVQNYIHIVFSTKFRQPLIKSEFQEELYNYLGGTCNQLNCQSLQVGGYYDHIHILCMLSKNITLVDLLEKVKSSSSKWMKQKSPALKNFCWQNGYGAFSVSPSLVNTVINYIKNQYQHHSKKTFQDEFRDFLKNYNTEFNEKYVWD